MADWTDPSTINTNPRAPGSSEFGTAALANPVAIAEGADGAPKIADKIVSGAGTTTVSGLEPFGGVFIRGAGADTSSSGSVSASLSIEYSTDGGITFSAPQLLGGSGAGSSNGGRVLVQVEVYIDFATAAFKGFSAAATGESTFTGANVSHLTGTVTGLTDNVTDIRLTGLDALLINPQGGDTAS